MTLIITILSNNKVIQVADCRLTLNGLLHDATAIKAVGVSCTDAQFCIGYTGVAEIEGKRTDYWLVDQVSDILNSSHHSIKALTWELAVRVEKAMLKLRYKGRPVKWEGRAFALTLAGYHNTEDGPLTRPFVTTISNMRHRGLGVSPGVETIFTVTSSMLRPGLPNSEYTGLISGAVSAIMAEDEYAKRAHTMLKQVMRQIKRVDLVETPSGKFTVDRLVAVVRQASKHQKYGRLIGRDCLAVVIHPNARTMGTYYHPEKASTMIRLPHLVTPWYAMVDAELSEVDR